MRLKISSNRLLPTSLLFLSSILVPLSSVAQASKEYYSVANVVPPSPTVAAMIQYGRTPIGTYTGTANVSIPIYEVKAGDLSFPITLNYGGTGGIKVEEIASWVGLGWSLDAGGVIHRQVRGIPDEHGIMVPNYRSQFLQYLSNPSTFPNLLAYYEFISNGTTDSEPDLYSFSFGGVNGQFIYDDSARFMEIPYNNHKIENITDSYNQLAWKITDMKGNEFHFLTREESDYLTRVKSGSNVSYPPPTLNNNFSSGWHLTFAVNKATNDTIHFTYEGDNYTNVTVNTATRSMVAPSNTTCGGSTYIENYNQNSMSGWRLKSIRFRGGTVTFTPVETARQDLTGSFALKSITVNNTARDLLKVDFKYRYLTTGYPSDVNASYGKRMMLDSVQFYKGGTKPESYTFQYNSTALPHRLSYSQDHWGYYNGKSNSYFTPPSWLNYSSGIFYIEGADKNPDSTFTKACVLEKIFYPTGGHTQFEYENNRVDSLSDAFDVQFSNRVFNLYGDGAGQVDYYEQTFTVNEQYLVTTGTFGRLSGNYGCTSGGGGGSTGFDCPNIRLYFPNGTSQQITQISYNRDYYLPKGTYTLIADFSHIPDPELKATRISSFWFSMLWRESYKSSGQSKNILVGGLRIRKISDYDNIGLKNVKQFQYTRFGSPTVSSGRLVNTPTYNFEYRVYPVLNSPDFCSYLSTSSVSQTALGSTQSSYVGYEQVTELNGIDGAFGKTEYEYSYPGNAPDNVLNSRPFPPADSKDFNRGQLRKQRVYRKNGANYELIQEIRNEYQDMPIRTARGLKVANHTNRVETSLDDYSATIYLTTSGGRLLKSDTAYFYGPTVNDKLVTSNIYGYNLSNLLVNFQQTTDSKGTVNVIRRKYPSDYAGLTGTTDLTKGIKFLGDNRFLAYEVETGFFRKDLALNKEYLLKGVFNTYRPTAPLKSKIHLVETPTELSDFNMSSVQAGNVVFDSRYKDEYTFNRYDRFGNITERRKANDAFTCYVWDYNYTYPVAEVMNADSVNVAYTSFETSVTGSWTVPSASRITAAAATGNQSYNLPSGQITRSGLTSTIKYIVSYWSNNATPLTIAGTQGTAVKGRTYNSWNYYEHTVTGITSLTISGTSYIDELRLYPQAATISTYTYEPLLGVRTKSDGNGQITFYEYDKSGRLKLIKDTDGKIIKHFDYQHSVPVTQ